MLCEQQHHAAPAVSPQNLSMQGPSSAPGYSSYSETRVNSLSEALGSSWMCYLESFWEQKSHTHVFMRCLLEERKSN